LAATVSPQIGGVPTGAITFLDNGNAIGTSPLNQSASASFSTTSLAAGTHAFTAVYSGDGNFFGSTSGGSVSVIVTQPDFSFSLGNTQLTIQPGQSVSTTLTVNPISGLAADLNLTCSGLPANVSCSLEDEGQIEVNQAPTQATLMVHDNAVQTLFSSETTKLRGTEICGLLGLAFAFSRKKRKAFSGWIASVLLLFAGLSLMISCGSGTTVTTPAPVTYNAQVTLSSASDASMTHSQTITIVIP
jgi:hypothetical protein